MTNSRIGPVLSCHVSLTCPDPVDEILSSVCTSVPSLTTSNMHILCRVYCRNYCYISIFAMRTVGTGLCWSRWGGAESSHHSLPSQSKQPSPRQRGTGIAGPGQGTRDRADTVSLEGLPACLAVSVLEFCLVFYTSCFS